MAKFQKGQTKPLGSGRKPGQPNKGKLLRVEEVMKERSFHVAEFLIDLLPGLPPDLQVKVALELLSYTQAKPKAREELPEEDENPTKPDLKAVSSETITELLNKNESVS